MSIKKIIFPWKKMRGWNCQFIVTQFDMFDRFEYNVKKDIAFHFVCYLFKNKTTISVA